ncbi:MAG: hypothetical protein HY852_17465 [Bradyrhizobium sp.]|uniref:hypothetical protein n=1 Tax=Bradyrhizobium sp. TaxID=376 RepID=UPI0025B9973D|nr:hypothetical protein [Bradyrhizobium sp.]MBI5263600.1 hypothetical protein [Bradyrhizobium sp.]
MPVELRADPSVRGHGRAVYRASDPDTSRQLILYDPRFERFLDHLVAHECGHIARFACASPADCVVPVLTRVHRRDLARQLLPEIERLIEAGLPEGAVAAVLPIWLGGTVAQLQNTPADIHIERWLHRTAPGLRGIQERSIADMALEYHQVLRPDVQACTPRQLWNASNAMNYAYLNAMSELLQRPEFIRPYRGTEAERTGRVLLSALDAVDDVGFVGDRSLSDRWATMLGLDGWLHWKRVDDVTTETRGAEPRQGGATV